MEKISWGSVLAKAALLVVIIAAITLFQSQFGSENLLIGIALITALLMFLKSDIGIKKNQAPLVVIGLFVAIVCASLLTSVSPFAVFAFNLVFIFAVMYLTTERIEDRAYLPFMLCYLFIQGIPVSGNVFVERLAAVIICGIIIAIVYVVVHWKKPSPQATVLSVFRNIDVHSKRFSFVLRMALGVSCAMLVGGLLQSEKAMWVGFTVFSLTQPDRLDVVHRFSKRLVGTLIGVVVFVIVFLYLIPQQYQPVAVLLFGYVYMFAKDYQVQMVFLTVNALAMAVLLFDPSTVIFGRIILIAVGFLIAFAVNWIPWGALVRKIKKRSA